MKTVINFIHVLWWVVKFLWCHLLRIYWAIPSYPPETQKEAFYLTCRFFIAWPLSLKHFFFFACHWIISLPVCRNTKHCKKLHVFADCKHLPLCTINSFFRVYLTKLNILITRGDIYICVQGAWIISVFIQIERQRFPMQR